MRTIVLKRPHEHAREQYLVNILDDGSVTVAYRGKDDRTWSPPATEVVSDTGEAPTWAFIRSDGLIPELHVFKTEAELEQEWKHQVDMLLEDGFACSGDGKCGGGSCAIDGEHTAGELYDSGFVTDWDDVELRRGG